MSTNIASIGHGRALHLIDAENLCGASLLDIRAVQRLRAEYMASVPVGPKDQMVLACAHSSGAALGAGWPGGQHKWRSGPDGADICLARTVVEDNIAHRFEHVYMGSGDGGLAPFAAHLAAQGVHVTAVTRMGSLSPKMLLATSDVIYLEGREIMALRAA